MPPSPPPPPGPSASYLPQPSLHYYTICTFIFCLSNSWKQCCQIRIRSDPVLSCLPDPYSVQKRVKFQSYFQKKVSTMLQPRVNKFFKCSSREASGVGLYPDSDPWFWLTDPRIWVQTRKQADNLWASVAMYAKCIPLYTRLSKK
jgi:hypothetical protein